MDASAFSRHGIGHQTDEGIDAAVPSKRVINRELVNAKAAMLREIFMAQRASEGAGALP